MRMEFEGGFRRRLGTACRACKKRKVRCDFNNTGPCTPCKRSRATSECEPSGTTRLSRRQRSQRRISQGSASSNVQSSKSIDPHDVLSVATSSPATTRDESLTAFYERGIRTRNWEVFHQSDPNPIRIVYIGNATANLHQLVQDEDPVNCLHYPFPSIKPLLPWSPEPNQYTASSYLTSRMTDDLSKFPTKDVRDSLVQTVSEAFCSVERDLTGGCIPVF
jgi:hypothetical protein